LAKRKTKTITAEEFAAWRADRVTEIVLKAHLDMAEKQKQAWVEASWNAQNANPLLLAELKTRADAYQAIAECSFEDVVGEQE
jgi:hypothetical protein